LLPGADFLVTRVERTQSTGWCSRWWFVVPLGLPVVFFLLRSQNFRPLKAGQFHAQSA